MFSGAPLSVPGLGAPAGAWEKRVREIPPQQKYKFVVVCVLYA